MNWLPADEESCWIIPWQENAEVCRYCFADWTASESQLTFRLSTAVVASLTENPLPADDVELIDQSLLGEGGRFEILLSVRDRVLF